MTLSLLEQFKEFHRTNPHVAEEWLTATRQIADAGLTRIGAGTISERLRWLLRVENVHPNSIYKFNENYSAFYARLTMMTDPTLDGIFKVKRTSVWSGRREDLIDCLPVAA